MQPIKIPNDIISISEDDDTRSYIYKHCDRNLIELTDSSGNNESWYCNTCNIEHFPEIEQIRSKSKLVTPEGRNTETLVSTMTPNPVSQFDSKPVEYKGGFKVLHQKGIRIKYYKETDGAGRTISSK